MGQAMTDMRVRQIRRLKSQLSQRDAGRRQYSDHENHQASAVCSDARA